MASVDPNSDDPDKRRSFRNRFLLLLLVFVCAPLAAYLDTLDLKHKPQESPFSLSFILLFFAIFMFLGYGALQFTRFVARKRFGEVEIAEQKAQNEKIQEQLDARKDEFEREKYGNRLFAVLVLILMPVFGFIGGALGYGFFNNPPPYLKLGAFLGLSLAYLISAKLTKRKFGRD